MKIFLPLLLVLLFTASSLSAQPSKFNTVLYGVAYYHEYMPYDRLDTDIQLMKDAGINVVRVGEALLITLRINTIQPIPLTSCGASATGE